LIASYECKRKELLQRIQGSSRVPWNPLICQWQTLDKLLKILHRCIITLQDFIARHSLSLLFTAKIIGNYVILHWYVISASKIINIVFVLETNTDDVHCWGVNICRDLLNPVIWKLRTIHWSHHMPTTKLTPFVVSEDVWEKGGPW